MKGVTRYIAKQIVAAVLFVTLALTVAVWLSQSLRFVDMIINHGLPLGLSFYFLALMMPSLLAVILPVSLFIAVMFVYHKLIVDSELVVLRAAGLSPVAIARPAMILASIVTLIGFSLTLYFLPASFRAFKDLQYTIRNSYAQVVLQEGVFTDIAGGLTFFARSRDAEGGLSGVMVYDGRVAGKPVTYTAAAGAIVTGKAGPRIIMQDGTYQQAQKDGEVSVLYFDRAVVELSELAPSTDPRSRDAKELFLEELFFPTNVENPERRNRLQVEGHQRLITPLYCFAFAVVGLAILLSGDFQRRGQVRRIASAILAVVLLQALSLGMLNLAGRMPTAVPLMYLGPVVPTLLGLLVLLWPRRGRRGVWRSRAARSSYGNESP